MKAAVRLRKYIENDDKLLALVPESIRDDDNADEGQQDDDTSTGSS
jgi:hypothetical protein